MKFGVMFPYGAAGRLGWASPAFTRAAAVRAEEVGFESVWAGEHVAFAADYEPRYPYSADGKTPLPLDTAYTDPFVQLAWVAAVTLTIRLGTAVVVLPERQPLIVAKEAATLDVLSGGRLILGVGLGWQKEEYDALGMSFERRGARADEYIGAMRALWTEHEASFHGRFARFDRLLTFPKPVRDGHLPIIVGGHSPAAARRAGRLGDGLFALVAEPSHVKPLRDEMIAAAEAAGRDPARLEMTVGHPPDEPGVRSADVLETVERYAAAGVDRIVLFRVFEETVDEMLRFLDTFAHNVISKI
jgi:probable F420-dependent oxidoreductase